MKKRSLKKLALKKTAISKLAENEKEIVKGGADTLFCQTFFCGFTNDCVTFTCNFTGLSCFGGC
ncbi:hypothetical protein H2O64_07735 [Kordia sp. YSTF-M3]|uniref:Natural product n=1 Tax=Kordia aestuariivivens TaxID=2759037 RepID=A0ABR7Q7N4_9FLAO|nr:class I lanthipeptide [Kordia aestuariivivens]MBC8754560.1 hypothetical protein [Kordia aestuariivivens]